MSDSKENALEDVLKEASAALLKLRDAIAPYAVTFTPRDRLRLRGVGIKRQGFVDNAFASAAENAQFVPRSLPIERFRQDVELSKLARDFLSLCKQLQDYAADFSMLASDTEYHDATLYFDTVKDAFERRIDGAESIFHGLAPFFKNMGSKKKGLTEKELIRDAKALLHGKIDGKIEIENVSPKARGGRRKVIEVKGTGSGE
jgi:hypothetical protein